MAHGGAAFVQALSRHGLIDEYRLVILPVALGNGLPLFKDLAKPLRLDLAEARSFPDGTPHPRLPAHQARGVTPASSRPAGPQRSLASALTLPRVTPPVPHTPCVTAAALPSRYASHPAMIAKGLLPQGVVNPS